MIQTSAWLLVACAALAACSAERPAPTATPERSSASPSQAIAPAPRAGAGPPASLLATGILPLATGVYVLAGSGCRAPANAGLRFYDGRGISGTATHDCVATIESSQADRYRLAQSCIDTPRGDGPRTRELQTVTVHDAGSFTLQAADGAGRFQRCPTDQVPDYLRERAGAR